jgi:very-short-patch-repair endonuclease
MRFKVSFKGYKHTEETKRKLSEALKGRKPNSGSFKKGQAPTMGMLGKHHTAEHNRKMSEAEKGRPSPMKGRKQSEATRLKMSKSRSDYLKDNPMVGRPQSDATRAKISKASLSHWENKEYRNRVMGRRTMSSLEEKFLNIIEKNNLPYKFVGNGKFYIERKNPDFININGEKKAIEVFYTRHKNQFAGGIDSWKENRSKLFSQYGWEVIYFNEVEVNEQNIINQLSPHKLSSKQ